LPVVKTGAGKARMTGNGCTGFFFLPNGHKKGDRKMKFKVIIETDNAAFQEDAAAEIVRILREQVIHLLETGKVAVSPTAAEGWPLRDINGNKVGVAKVGVLE